MHVRPHDIDEVGNGGLRPHARTKRRTRRPITGPGARTEHRTLRPIAGPGAQQRSHMSADARPELAHEGEENLEVVFRQVGKANVVEAEVTP